MSNNEHNDQRGDGGGIPQGCGIIGLIFLVLVAVVILIYTGVFCSVRDLVNGRCGAPQAAPSTGEVPPATQRPSTPSSRKPDGLSPDGTEYCYDDYPGGVLTQKCVPMKKK